MYGGYGQFKIAVTLLNRTISKTPVCTVKINRNTDSDTRADGSKVGKVNKEGMPNGHESYIGDTHIL